jgi:hypothetical protein
MTTVNHVLVYGSLAGLAISLGRYLGFPLECQSQYC